MWGEFWLNTLQYCQKHEEHGGGLGAQCNYREAHFNYFVKGKTQMSTAGEGQHQGLRPNNPTDPKEAEATSKVKEQKQKP